MAGPNGVTVEIVRGLSEIPCACIADVLRALELNGVAEGVHPLSPSMKVCGPAFTLRQIASQDRRRWAEDELQASKLLELASPGCVIVIDAGGRGDVAFWGENMAAAAQRNGVSGTVVDGAVRDSAEIVELGYPTFARGTALLNPHGAVRTVCVNSEPVQIGSGRAAVMVAPGDIVAGEADGLVVVPGERAHEVLELARRRLEADGLLADAVRSGSREEFDRRLAEVRRLEGLS